jgi:hypothetical protein
MPLVGKAERGARRRRLMKDDVAKLQKYLRKMFRNDALRVVMHPKKKDMAEVFIGDEFIAPLYREEEDGEVSYQFQMAILDVDLDEA